MTCMEGDGMGTATMIEAFCQESIMSAFATCFTTNTLPGSLFGYSWSSRES